MTPATPPAIPSDIPAEVWEASIEPARAIFNDAFLFDDCSDGMYLDSVITKTIIARALLAAQERGKLMEREKLTDPAFLQTCLTNVGLVGKEAVAEAVLAERERGDARVEAGRQFVKRHPALTLLDLAEFEAFVGYLDALERVEAATAEGN